MTRSVNKILVPVDLSPESQESLAFAADLAKCHNAKIQLCFVTLPPLPEQAAYAQAELDAIVLEEKKEFESIRPADESIEVEHHMLRGNPGPEIVSFAKANNTDLIVITTHGRTGLLRFLMGSVAEYVVRNASCLVVTLKSPPAKLGAENQPVPSQVESRTPPEKKKFVTSIMQHTHEIHDYDEMAVVAADLQKTGEQCVPVVDIDHQCIGVLTDSDIQKYQQTCVRLAEEDPSVLPEVYPKNEFGLLRCDSDEFHRVKWHMSSPVVTIRDIDDCNDALKCFQQNKGIHHLVVVDADQHPVGVLNAQDLISEVASIAYKSTVADYPQSPTGV